MQTSPRPPGPLAAAALGWRRDLAHAARRLAARPGWSGAVVATLALGVAAVAVLGSAARGILLHPLPYAEPERLVHLWLHDPKSGVEHVEAAWADLEAVREGAAAFSGVALVTATNFRLNLTGGDEPVQVEGAAATPDLFALAGATAQAGRTFVTGDEENEEVPAVVLSDSLWRRSFAADPAVVGRDIELDGGPATVVGVAPPDFAIPAAADLWFAAAPPPADPPQARALRVYKLVARLAPGVTPEQAAADLARVSRRLEEREPERNRGLELVAEPFLDAVYGDTRPALALLAVASALVLLVAAANVAGLLLVGAARRQGELALRGIHGAGPGRLARLLLAETALLAAAAGLGGLLLSAGALAAWPALAPPDVPFAGAVRLDGGTLALGLAVAAATMLACSLAPLARVVRLDLASAIRRGDDRSLGGAGRLRRALVVAQVAVCLAVLAGAAAVAAGYRSLAALEPGFDPEGVVAARLSLRWGSLPTVPERAAFYERLRQAIEARPEVESAGLVLLRPLSDPIGWEYPFLVEGQSVEEQEKNPPSNYLAVSAGAFEALRVPLVAGRPFAAADRTPERRVVLISRGMAERYWPGGDAVGRRLKVGRVDEEAPWHEVIGVVGDVRYRGWDVVRYDVYVPMEAWSFSRMDFVVRGRDGVPPPAAALREPLRALDPGLALSEVVALDEEIDRALAGRRFAALAVAGLALVALLLTAVGLGALLAAWVAGLERELGLRLALGAERRHVARLVARQSGLLVGLGLLLGVALALLAGRALAGTIHGLEAAAPAALAASCALLALAAALGTAAPLRRALAADPLAVLRGE